MILVDDVNRKFDERYIPEPNTGCWLWIGTTVGIRPYPMFYAGKSVCSAQRFSHERVHGPIRPGFIIRTKCGMDICVNPLHTFLKARTKGPDPLEIQEVAHLTFEFPDEKAKWLWLAAIIDAESSLELVKSKSRSRTLRGFKYMTRMNCSSTTIALLLQVSKACAPYGNISSHHHQDGRGDGRGWKRVNQLRLFGNGLRVVLPKVFPYLVVKKQQAAALLEALPLLHTRKLSLGKEERLEALWMEVRNLNAHGNT